MTATNRISIPDSSHLLALTVRGCEVARLAAVAVSEGITSSSTILSDQVRKFEEELDTLDRQVNEDVTSTLEQGCGNRTRELLSCLKFIIELERIGDLLLDVANRLQTVGPRLQSQDAHDLSQMAAILSTMLADVGQAFGKRDVRRALEVLKADAELDRLRNLLFVRHIENPQNEPRQESFHLVFMSQALERGGDHAKNLAEEICHLVSGRSVRHILRDYDRPVEQVYLERMRRSRPEK
ncbi:MAG TPA: PhoU domain-containing protein [Terriglobales bacterium]|jgi:phosphate transport system protein